MKAIARLGLAWLLMFAGTAMVLEGGMAERRSRSRTLAVVECLGGFALVAGGAVLRRTGTRRDHPR
jgi:hypothetical protein